MTRQRSNFFPKIFKNPHPINKIFKNDTTCLYLQSHYHPLASLDNEAENKSISNIKIDQGPIKDRTNYFKSPSEIISIVLLELCMTSYQ